MKEKQEDHKDLEGKDKKEDHKEQQEIKDKKELQEVEDKKSEQVDKVESIYSDLNKNSKE